MKMSSISVVVEKYQEILNSKPGFKFSGNRPTFGVKGVANRIFYLRLFHEPELFFEFLKETGLIKRNMICSKCNGEMKIKGRKNSSEGWIWYCRKSNSEGANCDTLKSPRYGSWFMSSRLNIPEIMMLTYEIVSGAETCHIIREYGFATSTLADWRLLVHETILDYVVLSSEKIGGVGKKVEIDVSKFGKRKFKRGRHVEGQWFIGGIERGSGKFFLVGLEDGSQETFVGAVKEWIEPGTDVCSNDGVAYSSLGEEGIQYLTVNHNINFMDSSSSFRINETETEESFPEYNHRADYLFHLATFLFKKSCKEKNVDLLNQFLEFVKDVNWEVSRINIK